MEHDEIYGYASNNPRYELQVRLANFYKCDILTVGAGWHTLTRCRRPDDGCWFPYNDIQMIDDPRWYESLRS